MISSKIEEFLREHGSETFKEHVTKLKAFHTFLKDVEATPVLHSKNGENLIILHGHMMIVKLDLTLAGVCMLKRKKKMP